VRRRLIRPVEPQRNYEQALAGGLEKLRRQAPETLAELGARQVNENRYELPVLNDAFLVDLETGKVGLSDRSDPPVEGATIRLEWQILAVHYLSAPPPWPGFSQWISFADVPGARGYDSVYRGRVLGRLCATVGKHRATLVEAARILGASSVEWGDVGLRFRVFPRVEVIIAWYAGDEELGPGASFVYGDNIASFLSVEDVVVLSERLVSRLQGSSW